MIVVGIKRWALIVGVLCGIMSSTSAWLALHKNTPEPCRDTAKPIFYGNEVVCHELATLKLDGNSVTCICPHAK